MLNGYSFNDDTQRKKKFNMISLVLFAIFIVMFTLMVTGFSYWGLGKIAFVLMLVFPLSGGLIAFKGTGFLKWLLILLNFFAFLLMVYILLAAIGIGGM
ncbi:hypothetical protein [Halobacillus sp. Marseille-Q1614]|uniref:hypothetical protein n=1 Tax=Halobacillus sp. Marseille-Q1614 TaxID=2709134 RepID=UPI00156F9115|nr:hypothetical protein [Halobacillus sp. Marseille-Q1614]